MIVGLHPSMLAGSAFSRAKPTRRFAEPASAFKSARKKRVVF
jgi:hypothetical protein